MLVCQPPQFPEEFWTEMVIPALTLDWLDDQASNITRMLLTCGFNLCNRQFFMAFDFC